MAPQQAKLGYVKPSQQTLGCDMIAGLDGGSIVLTVV